MTKQDPYRSFAQHYDADYELIDRQDDIAYYVELARTSGGPVLELGCGTGRVLLPTARAGLEVHGVDNSAAMLDKLRDKLSREPAEVEGRIELSLGAMQAVLLGKRFPLITAPFRGVQHLLDRREQRGWLSNVARHLAPQGCLAFDVFQPDFSFMAGPTGPAVDVDRTDLETGYRLQRSAATLPHPELQTMDISFEWVVTDHRGVEVERSRSKFTIRWFTKGEIENLLELEGFEVVEYWGSFDQKPFGEGSKEQVVVAAYRG